MSDDPLTIIKVVSLKHETEMKLNKLVKLTLNPDRESSFPDGAVGSELYHHIFTTFGEKCLVFVGNRSPTQIHLKKFTFGSD